MSRTAAPKANSAARSAEDPNEPHGRSEGGVRGAQRAGCPMRLVPRSLQARLLAWVLVAVVLVGSSSALLALVDARH